jgi:hypothetical protein
MTPQITVQELQGALGGNISRDKNVLALAGERLNVSHAVNGGPR